jgi:hypothetical protein
MRIYMKHLWILLCVLLVFFVTSAAFQFEINNTREYFTELSRMWFRDLLKNTIFFKQEKKTDIFLFSIFSKFVRIIRLCSALFFNFWKSFLSINIMVCVTDKESARTYDPRFLSFILIFISDRHHCVSNPLFSSNSSSFSETV